MKLKKNGSVGILWWMLFLLTLIIMPRLACATSYAIPTRSWFEQGKFYVSYQYGWYEESSDVVECLSDECIVHVCEYNPKATSVHETCSNPHPDWSPTYYIAKRGDTTKDIFHGFTAKFGNHGSVEREFYNSRPVAGLGNFCFLIWQGTKIPSLNRAPLTGTHCGTIPPVNQVCNAPDSLLFDHGVVSERDLNGHKKETSMFVECTSSVSVKITLLDVIKLTNNVKSSIYTSYGENLSDGVVMTIPPSGLNIPLVSILSSTGNFSTDGELTGVGVIVLDIL